MFVNTPLVLLPIESKTIKCMRVRPHVRVSVGQSVRPQSDSGCDVTSVTDSCVPPLTIGPQKPPLEYAPSDLPLFAPAYTVVTTRGVGRRVLAHTTRLSAHW